NMKNSLYIQHKGKVAEAGKQFKHVMAVTLDPRTENKEGIIRCITSRTGEYGGSEQIDRSALFKIKGETLEEFEITEELKIKNFEEIISKIKRKDGDFIGLEDPDIWIDEKNDLMHVYFTMPVKTAEKNKEGENLWNVSLGHAVGKDLDSLEMTKPVLIGTPERSAKEISIAPINSKGFRYNLIESSDKKGEWVYSTVQVVIARDMGNPWEFGKIAFHPAEHKIPWIAGHASPGPLLPRSFIDLGKDKMLGIMNGCVANKRVGSKIKYGTFSVGLFIYDYEKGKIDWVSPKPFIEDTETSEERAITFASQFVETKQGEGILYAHVDDSFVRAYSIYADKLEKLLP
ncbi:hypothetical protein KKC45_03745, partial [Patescibacteria group bacterium]|nr:hypothetical protein [Patescibacteria group bacterium]